MQRLKAHEQGQIFLEEEAPVKSKTEVIITFLTEGAKNTGIQKRVPGGLKGKVVIPNDFNEPLDDLKDCM